MVDAFVLAGERTPEQDIRYQFQQLTDVIIRALSPGINDPFTAINGIDELERVLRVRLDYELKDELYLRIPCAAKDRGRKPEAIRGEVAERHHLKVVSGKISIPYLRIEYVNRTTTRRTGWDSRPSAMCSSSLAKSSSESLL